MNNSEIAEKLREIARLLEEQGANPFRVNAYRRAANTINDLEEAITSIIQNNGISGLTALPGIGEGIARSIYEYVAMGRMSRLESLHTGHDPIALYEKIPGVGATLAHRIIDALHIDTLEALEVAAHNGRLANVPGFSKNKVEMILAWLEHVLGYRRPRPHTQEAIAEAPVSLLLQVDCLYREKAEAGELPTIAPKRFNPNGKDWLPVLHMTKEGWHFTALYSNTPRAHQLGRVKDWVVIYFYDDQHHEGQCTVVTETHGPLTGQRVVRGREAEGELENLKNKVNEQQ